MDPDQTAQSDLGPHCLPVCKNKFEKFARIFSRRHKQTTFSDASFLGALRVNLKTSRLFCNFSRIIAFPIRLHVRPAKIQTSLRINEV